MGRYVLLVDNYPEKTNETKGDCVTLPTGAFHKAGSSKDSKHKNLAPVHHRPAKDPGEMKRTNTL